ncbi:MAG: hypothetical protein U0746_09760 [Gemmataceae bacterium]
MSDAPLVHLLVEIELAGDEFAADEELDIRDRLVAVIEDRGIGEVGGFGSGSGGMDVSVLVRDEAAGREQVAAVVRELAPGATFTIEVLPDEEDEDAELGPAADGGA